MSNPRKMILMSNEAHAQLVRVLEDARDEFRDASTYCHSDEEAKKSLERKAKSAEKMRETVDDPEQFTPSLLESLIQRSCEDVGPEFVDPEAPSNETRAGWADIALEAFGEATGVGGDNEELETIAQDLVTDLCHRLRLSLDDTASVEGVLARGYRMYLTEYQNELELAAGKKAAEKTRLAAERRIKSKKKSKKKS